MPGLIAAVGDLAGWPSWVAIAGLVAAELTVCLLVWTPSVWTAASLAVKTLAVAAGIASFFWMITMTQAPRLTVLALRGEPVIAEVVEHDVIDYGRHEEHCYRLQRANAVAIPGRICRSRDELTKGRTVTVLVDPGGLIAAETPAEVAHAPFWQTLAPISLTATLILCWISGGITASPPAQRQNY
ncbi:hypothetical protein ACFQ1L_09280 [Phytohabitans flavus]|uniref:hypothetical protein n=1 Tax=Phytohabitans flavus TaxID=1076124 RepID=UPI001567C5A7|nr:hypothetical protein [Phytohabitans flavus]